MKAIHKNGKRKTSIAKATLKEGKGIIRVNSILLENHTPEIARMKIMEPLILAGDQVKKFNININVHGGGWSSQAEASRLAIARCLVETNKTLKKKFLDYDRHLLVADTRRKEMCKPNDSKARAKRQKSYR
ncbi:30S ribosomal protein S9 [Candidatus Woesearchaeota archaeon]|jgi:small subunit ribosomal protein S9|nr:30S ribosomal protein S9 [Candidatus Woesearchaeota archaeon]MBT4321799.1 30S ribosomal protein S9 [Candidatus Woesearchaeota archaeon]MBT4630807.1 30S ribosomal protein S9 [Candidatus Woesearchaeota archaeon]